MDQDVGRLARAELRLFSCDAESVQYVGLPCV